MLRLLERLAGLNVCRVMARPLDRSPERHPLVELRNLAREELLAHCADPELELDAFRAGAALARGDLCVGALRGGRLVGYQFVGFGPTPHVGGIWVEFAPQSRYSYKAFVRRELRGQRVHQAMNWHSDALCRARGLRAGIRFVDFANRASVRASQRSGYRTVGYAGYLRVPGGTCFFRSAGARRAGFRFYRPGAVELASTLSPPLRPRSTSS